MIATDTIEANRPALDQALLDSFRAEMHERRRLRASKAPAQTVGVDDVIELVEAGVSIDGIPDSSAVEAPIGTGYDFDEPKTEVGGFIPKPGEGYAYQKVLSIRLRALDTPTIEPTDATLEEFDRIEAYNIDIVDKKKTDKKAL